jgi:hypothetical protein
MGQQPWGQIAQGSCRSGRHQRWSGIRDNGGGPDLRLKRVTRIPYYRLEDLIAEMDRLGPENVPETVDWGPDRGAEIIDDAYSRGEITLEDILTGKAKGKNAS